MKKLIGIIAVVFATFLTGCATVPMAPVEEDQFRKEFPKPSDSFAGLYIYRNSNLGAALKKTITVDGEVIGETGPMTYFFKEIEPGTHTIATESEFSDNTMELTASAGQNYFVRQYIKWGVFVGGANIELVSEAEGKEGVKECQLAE